MMLTQNLVLRRRLLCILSK